MQSQVTYGIKIDQEELKKYYEDKNVDWNSRDPIFNFEEKNLEKVFTDLPDEILMEDLDYSDSHIFGFDILSTKHHDRHYGSFEIPNLNVPKDIRKKMKAFIKNNNLKDKECSFFVLCYETA